MAKDVLLNTTNPCAHKTFNRTKKIKRYPARLAWWLSRVLGAFGVYFALSSSSTTLAKESAPAKPRLIESYGKIPLSFEQNQGQADEAVKVLSRGPG